MRRSIITVTSRADLILSSRSRKFNLPHYPHTLKWKLIPGNSYVVGVILLSFLSRLHSIHLRTLGLLIL